MNDDKTMITPSPLNTGFSRSNLQNMRNFYLAYPICQTLSGKLLWSHYCELLELGRGFMFVGSQQRVTLGNTHY
jgi:predicted nuclease of restriction endonuclease-like (RecB) superfamily